MRSMTESSPGVWLVSDGPGPGVKVYKWDPYGWSCYVHGPIGAEKEGRDECDHIKFVRSRQATYDDREAPIHTDLWTIDATHDSGLRDLESQFGEEF